MLDFYWSLILNGLARTFSGATSIPCAGNSSITTVEDLISCFDAYTVTQAFYSPESYVQAQPSPAESSAWIDLVHSMLYIDGNCTSLTIPNVLSDVYGITLFTEQSTSTPYCVLHELNAIDSGVYAKGWGLMVVPNDRSSTKLPGIHISAPHPAYDLHTPQQAAALFAGTGAKSLLISGRIRTALFNATECIHPSSASTVYYKTDPAHDDKEPFVVAIKEIHKWQNATGGCPGESCAFVQMHGKGASTCSTDQMFLSSGLGRSASSINWYTSNPNLPINRLQRNLRTIFPSWNISSPSDSECGLTATTNVFGRLVNGVAEDEVCVKGATAQGATGEFIHIEQASVSRQAEQYDAWIGALKETFGA